MTAIPLGQKKMSRLSKKHRKVLETNIKEVLVKHYPNPLTTTQVADVLGRDNEFVGKILYRLAEEGKVRRYRIRANRFEWKWFK